MSLVYEWRTFDRAADRSIILKKSRAHHVWRILASLVVPYFVAHWSSKQGAPSWTSWIRSDAYLTTRQLQTFRCSWMPAVLAQGLWHSLALGAKESSSMALRASPESGIPERGLESLRRLRFQARRARHLSRRGTKPWKGFENRVQSTSSTFA